MMQLSVFDTPERLARRAARAIIDAVAAKSASLLCFAAGETPLLTLRYLADAALAGETDLSACRFVSLDEWVGLGARDEGSCRQTLQAAFFGPLGIGEEQIRFFDAASPDLAGECAKMDALIDEAGGLDFILLGIGLNGHLGFNEPGSAPDAGCFVAELDETTRRVSAKYFPRPTDVRQGITLGLRHILSARTALLLATGPKKADIVRQAVRGPATPDVPGSLLQLHPSSYLYADRDAAAGLR